MFLFTETALRHYNMVRENFKSLYLKFSDTHTVITVQELLNRLTIATQGNAQV